MTTLERLNKCLASLGLQEATSPDQRFVEDLGLDSLDWIELVVALEEEYAFDEIPESVYGTGQMDTVGKAIEYLDSRTDANAH